ncbi:MAG TPA: OmpA family protein, partial [Sneathiellales bacterium]|nr:OmpA family protein [Sneathiellales bacterium]
MAIFKTASVVVLTGTLTLSGCVNPDGTTNNTGTGASVGAVLGGLLGRAVSDDKGKGTIIGGLIGGAIGGAIGSDLDAQEAALRESMGGSVSIINTGTQLIVSLPEEITFATNSAVVKYSLVADLNTLAASMNAYPNTMIEVVGHTDNTGTSAYNQALSEQRARAVRGILINIVNPNRVLAYGVGKTRPVASNSSSAGRQANRR